MKSAILQLNTRYYRDCAFTENADKIQFGLCLANFTNLLTYLLERKIGCH